MKYLLLVSLMLTMSSCSCSRQTELKHELPDNADIEKSREYDLKNGMMHDSQNIFLFKKTIIALYPSEVDFDDPRWERSLKKIENYPMKFHLRDSRATIIRLALDPDLFVFNNEWVIEPGPLEEQKRSEDHYKSLMTAYKIADHKEEQLKILYFLYLYPDAEASFGQRTLFLLSAFQGYSRPSTFSGAPPIEVTGASFIANFAGEGSQSLTGVIGNLSASLIVGEETNGNIVSNATLGEMASRLSALFDPPPDDARDADPGGLIVNLLEQDEDGPRIVVETPEDGPYSGWWLRLDTNAGRISVEAPGRAVIKGMPEEGATITVYAISPDGEQWHRLSRLIEYKREELINYALFERDGNVFVLAWKRVGEVDIEPIKLPKSQIPFLNITNLDEDHLLIKQFNKYPELKKREIELENNPEHRGYLPEGIAEWRARPRSQIYEEWLGYYINNNIMIFEIDRQDIIRRINNMGQFWGEGYSRVPTIMGVEREYRIFNADLVKPFLFQINGSFYSIYGDTQVAEHIAFEGARGLIAALRYAGNILYAFSKELPPALQSCGTDKNGYIWLADIDGYVAFFNTETKQFIQKIVKLEDANRVRIPRNNQALNLFFSKGEDEEFQEFRITVGHAPILMPGERVLPHNTEQILYSDDNKIVFVIKNSVMVKADDGKVSSSPIAIKDDEYIVEGAYDIHANTVTLLVAESPQGKIYHHLYERYNSWQLMRLEDVYLFDIQE